MAAKSIGPVLLAIVLASDDVTDYVDDRMARLGGTLQEEPLPYLEYSVDSNRPNKDVDGDVDDYTAEFAITVTASTYDECDAIARAVAEAFENAPDATVDPGTGPVALLQNILDTLGVQVGTIDEPDIDDTPNGPIDLDGAEVYQSDVRCSLNYL